MPHTSWGIEAIPVVDVNHEEPGTPSHSNLCLGAWVQRLFDFFFELALSSNFDALSDCTSGEGVSGSFCDLLSCARARLIMHCANRTALQSCVILRIHIVDND